MGMYDEYCLWAQVVVLLLLGLYYTVWDRYMHVLYLGRAPRTKETLSDFREKCRVVRHSRVFRGLTGSQRIPGIGVSQLLSILFLYFCFYTLHIPYSFYNLLFYVFDISSIYTFISQILSHNLSYTVLYFYLHSYTFHIRYFCYFHLFLVFFIFQFYDLLHSMYYYIYHLLSRTYIISPFM